MPRDLEDNEYVGLEPGGRVATVNPRDLAMQMIEDGRLKEFEQESGLKVPEQPAIDEDMDADAVLAEQERARLVAREQGTEVVPPRPEPITESAQTVIDNFDNVLVKRKVNGVEELVPLSDVMRTHQVATSADQRLLEATRLLREAEARSAPVKEEPAPPAASDFDDMAKKFTSALFSGDEVQAQALFKEAMGSRPSPQATPASLPIDQLARQVEQHMAQNRALETFREDYPRLAGDPRLAKMTDEVIFEKMNAGMGSAEAILASGKELYESFGWSKPVPPGRSDNVEVLTTRRREKLEAKARLDTIPVLSVSASNLKDDNSAESPSDVIRQMAQSRGQA